MPTVKYSLSLSVAGGPYLVVDSNSISAEATDSVEVSIASGDPELTVEIQPSALAKVHVILIESSLYSEDLTFKFSDGVTDSVDLTIDSPQLHTNGSLALLGSINPTQMKINLGGTGLEANISVFVARNAT